MTALDQSPAARAAGRRLVPAMLPRDPQERLAALFDPGTLEVLPVEIEERSGVVAGTGLVHGVSAVAFASDARVQGGAMGTAGCAAIVAAYAEALVARRPDRGAVALRRGPAGRGRGQPARRGHRVRGDDAGLRPGAADLGGARAGRGRRRLRPRADRHRDPVRAGAHLRHRPGRGALGDRRGRGHGTARRARAAQPPVRRGARGDFDRRGRPGPGARARGHAQRPGQDRRGRRGARPVRPAARLGAPRVRRAPADRQAARHAGRRAASALGAEHRDHPRPPGRPHGRRRGQQPDAARRLPGRRLGGEGGALRADVRRVRRTARGPGGRARIPARRRPGMGRRGPPGRQAAARLRRGHGPAGDAGDPQGLRRRLHRDELPRRSARPASSPGRAPRSP